MAQSLELNIKTTSDVPQAMDKAKSATSGFGKQVEDIQRKFSTGFKDIFLGFFAPMVILNNLMSTIRDNIEEARRLAKEGVELISKGEGVSVKPEEVTLSNIVKTKQAADEKERQTEEGQKFLINWFLYNTKEGKLLAQAAGQNMISPEGSANALEKFGGYEGLLKKYLESPEGKAAIGNVKTDEQKTSAPPVSFKSPEGFSNVVGMGANPVIEAMTAQLEEARKQTILLESLNNKATGGGVPTDFTKSTSPSRAALLKGGN